MEKIKLQKIVKNSKNYADVLRNCGLRAAGGNFKSIKAIIHKHQIDISHFETGIDRVNRLHSNTPIREISIEKIFTENSIIQRKAIKQRLYESGLKERKCELCGQSEIWHGKKLSLILDHINGVWDDNRLENLRIVCPNCNATLETHCGKNKSKRSIKKIENGFLPSDDVDFRNVKTKEKLNSYINKRKIDRPPLSTLLQEIEMMGYCATGRKYGVSDNAIRKWVSTYHKYNI